MYEDRITCTDSECWLPNFTKEKCNEMTKEKWQLKMKLGKNPSTYQISIAIESFFVMGDQMHENDEFKTNCYFPIFTITDRGNDELKSTI